MKAKVTASSGKRSWDCEGIIMTGYLENGQPVTGDYN